MRPWLVRYHTGMLREGVSLYKTVNYDFAANFYDLAAKFSRLIFNEIAVIL